VRARFYLTAAAAGLVLAIDANATVFTLTVGSAATPTLSSAANTANADLNLSNTYDILIPTKATPYVNDFADVTRPMTIEASGGAVTLQANGALLNNKGIIVMEGPTASLTVKGITFQGAAISDALGGNGAGIRDQSTGATTLRVENSSFVGNQDGILTAGSNFQENVQIVGSTFLDNGSGSGQTHALYVGDAASLMVSGSLFCGTNEGHDIKSRAASTTVTGSQIFDGATGAGCASAGTTSYGIDVPNGGIVDIENTDLIQGPGTHNSTMLRFGEEGLPYASNSLDITNTDFLSTSGGIGIQSSAASGCTLQNTTFSGLGTNVDPASFCTIAGASQVDEPSLIWLAWLGGLSLTLLYAAPRRRVPETGLAAPETGLQPP
jgi:hypothetical protein